MGIKLSDALRLAGTVSKEVCDEIASLETDAERYLLLRNPDRPKDGLLFACVYVHPQGTIPYQRAISGDELDTLTSAALARENLNGLGA